MGPQGHKTEHIPKLTISHWNADGLKEKLPELEIYLKEYKIDIMCINETNYNKYDKCYVPGYRCYRQDRQSARRAGGVLMLVRNDLECSEIPLETQNTEAKAVRLENKLTVIAVYLPPKSQFVTAEFEYLIKTDDKVIIIGDLNCKHPTWNSNNRPNSNGTRLFKFLENNQCNLLAPDRYTHYSPAANHKPSIIDLAIVKNITNCRDIKVLDELDSGHLPIILNISNNLNIKSHKLTFLDYSRADWQKFRSLLNNKIDLTTKINNNNELDEAVRKLTLNIQETMKDTIPTITTGRPNDRVNNTEIREIIKERNILKRISQRTGNQEDKTAKNKLTNIIKRKLKAAKNEELETKLINLSPKDNSLWKFAKFLTKKRDNVIPPLHGPTGLVFGSEEKANVLAQNFEKVHHLTQDFGDEETETKINAEYEKMKTSAVSLDEIKYVSPREVKNAIRNTKSKKAPGQDGIQNIVLKNLPHKAIVYLTYIFNASFKLSYFSTAWKNAEVLAFPKPNKDKKFPQNYRPISLLSTISKIYEKIILNRLQKFEKEAGNLIDEQLGFREGKFTVQQLARITNQISNGFNENKSTAMLLLDIEKAFDTVWHQGLIYKLNSYNIPKYIIKIIISYLENRTFSIKVNNSLSQTQIVVAGVPQGSILGPILFLYFINDIPKSKNTNLALFADDTAIIAQSWRKEQAIKYLQDHIEKLENYYETWKIKINVTKTELVIFSKKEKKKQHFTLHMNDTPIQSKKEAKYLGVILDQNLDFNSHIKNAKKKGYAAMSLLYNLLNRNSKVSTKNKLLLYKMIIRPLITYGTPVWSNCSKKNLKILETIQNKIIRMIGRAEQRETNEKIRLKLNIKSLEEQIFMLTKNFYENKTKNQEILKNIGEYTKLSAPFKIKHKLPHQMLLNEEYLHRFNT